MAFTGVLGAQNSMIGNIILGVLGAPSGGGGGGGSIFDIEIDHVLAITHAGTSGGHEFTRSVEHAMALSQGLGIAYEISVETVIATRTVAGFALSNSGFMRLAEGNLSTSCINACHLYMPPVMHPSRSTKRMNFLRNCSCSGSGHGAIA